MGGCHAIPGNIQASSELFGLAKGAAPQMSCNGSAWDPVFFFLPAGLEASPGKSFEVVAATAEDRLEFFVSCSDSGDCSNLTSLATQPPGATRSSLKLSAQLCQPTPVPCGTELSLAVHKPM